MPKNSTTKGTKKRVKVKDLPASKKKLTGKQMKKVKGGSGLPTDQLAINIKAPKLPTTKP